MDEYRTRLGIKKNSNTSFSFSFLKSPLNHKKVRNKINLFVNANAVTVMKFARGISPSILADNETELICPELHKELVISFESKVDF